MRVVRLLLGLLLIGALALGALAAGGYYYANEAFYAAGPAAADEAPETVFVLERGSGLKRVAATLERDGLIENALIFEWGVRFNGQGEALKAGEYAIPSQASMAQIMALLVDGKAILHKLTVAEGLSVAQVVDLVNAHEALAGEITEAPEEGRLLPETYLFQRGTERNELLARMRAAKDTLLEEIWPNRADDLPFDTQYEALILASIVEKETGIAEERPMVASVFVNRLRRGIRLQSDPTVIYPITQGKPLGRRIRRSELDSDNPYNTYRNAGLPPTPIANPGRESLLAVLNPPQTDYYYFVADGTGGHAFSRTLAEHNRNVAEWRRVQRERGLR